MRWCRGPLPDGHPQDGVHYFCPDQDVAELACNLLYVPVVEKLRYIEGDAILLDAHRAPDDWFALACRMPRLLLQGDPDALRPKSCNLFAKELAKHTRSVVTRVVLCPRLQHTPHLKSAMQLARGKWVILVGSHGAAAAVYRHVRPEGVQKGDIVHDMHGRSGVVSSRMSGKYISVDDGRRTIMNWSQHLVVSPSCVRAGEYDTVIVMPDVAFSLACAACRRTRYMIVGVAHSPRGYVWTPLND